jgi:hypothetical protein
MLYSLPSRDLIADSVEYMCNAHCADALVCISNCDKITPGMLMAAMRLNIPVVFVSGGPMEAGKATLQGKVVGLDLVDAMVAAADSRVSDADVDAIERSACPTCGSCSGMFTANSMNCLTEALGLSLPGNGSLVATHAERKQLFLRAGRTVVELCKRYYDESASMTDRLAMLDLLENYAPHLAKPAFAHFYERHSDNTLVMNKYFTLLASCRREGTLEHVIALQEDKAFDEKVPNLVRSLIGSFARNLVAFHALNGRGYDFVADKIIEIDAINPQIASGLAGAFKSYEKLSPIQKGKMGSALERIKAHPSLSNNVNEIVSKILNH